MKKCYGGDMKCSQNTSLETDIPQDKLCEICLDTSSAHCTSYDKIQKIPYDLSHYLHKENKVISVDL